MLNKRVCYWCTKDWRRRRGRKSARKDSEGIEAFGASRWLSCVVGVEIESPGCGFERMNYMVEWSDPPPDGCPFVLEHVFA